MRIRFFNSRCLKFMVSMSLFFAIAACAKYNDSTNINQDGTIDLVILATSDVHGNLYSYNYEDDRETDNNGMARVATYVDLVRKENKNVILIDDGDTIQGTILTDDLYNKDFKSPHPVIKVMNYMKYDSMNYGNHEFNFGLDILYKINKEANFPILGANIAYKKDKKPFAPPYTIVERDGLKIGIIGMVTPQVPRWDGDKVEELEFYSLSETATKYADILRNKEKCDIIIVSAHAGLIPEYEWTTGSDGAELIAKLVKPDVLIVGHMHMTVAEKIGDTIIGGPRNSGREVVRFDLTVKPVKNGKPTIVYSSVEIIDMKKYAPSAELRKLIQKEHEKTLEFIKVGIVNDDGKQVGGIIGEAAADFQPVNELKRLPEARLRDTALVDLVNKVQLQYSGADVCSTALLKDSSSVKKGIINYGVIFDIYKFDNTIYVLEVTGKELKNYMEWSAKSYNQYKDGDISISFNPEIAGYLYDMFEGVEYDIDISQPEGNRIKNVIYKGKPLQDSDTLKLCVNNYRYNRTLKGENIAEGYPIWESPRSIRDYIVDYIQKQEVIYPEVTNNWKIIGVDLNHKDRDEIIRKANNNEIDYNYYNKSLNINELKQDGLL